MSFRRITKEALKWQQWLLEHRDTLLACNIPLTVLEEEAHWLYFLDHGYFTPADGHAPVIQLEHMSATDAVKLRSFLEYNNFYPDSSTLRWLRHRLPTPATPKP
jgi:hypothetical protein